MKKISRRAFLIDAAVKAASLSVFSWPFMLSADSKNTLFTAAIPATGEKLPRLGLGTYSTFDVGLGSGEVPQVKEVLQAFYAAGGRLVDSSPMYGNAEAVTGAVSTDLGINAELFMATKVWISGREAGLTQMQDSLTKFRRRKIELMQIHNLVDWRTQLKTLRENKERGVYKYIGLTHYMTSAFSELEKIIRAEKLDFLQIPYSLGETSAEAHLLGAAAEKGVAVIANEPFGQGALFRHARGKTVPAWAVEKGITTWAQYFLKFIFSNSQVQFAIPATRKLAHLRDNIGGGQGYLPTAAERQQMRREFSAL
jgi:diketogulonate reductase-like aldo/keto reductase